MAVEPDSSGIFLSSLTYKTNYIPTKSRNFIPYAEFLFFHADFAEKYANLAYHVQPE
jgi:hypothetical protein